MAGRGTSILLCLSGLSRVSGVDPLRSGGMAMAFGRLLHFPTADLSLVVGGTADDASERRSDGPLLGPTGRADMYRWLMPPLLTRFVRHDV